MRTKRRAEPVPIVPMPDWDFWGDDYADALRLAEAGRTFRVRVPKARKPRQRVEAARIGRFALLWAGDANNITVIAGVGRTSADWNGFVLALYRGYTFASYTPDIVAGRSRSWHQRRAIENARAATAALNEHTAIATSTADEAWLRKQLSTLDTNERRN